MNQLITSGGAAVTMTNSEIAALCKKDHGHVMRDIRVMLAELELDQSNFGSIFLDGYNREQPCLNLPKDLTLTLVSGYNVVLRKRIVDRWLELESRTPELFIPTTLAGALRLVIPHHSRRTLGRSSSLRWTESSCIRA